ncbi:MAG: CDP-alcohol phosphatidyltransferase family protein [Actinomycetia bacterium]|jgi:CDP-diacylglycerol--glycerol-3-phosphate 3-phosphatidyltransferase|nr:CDP-alcohol phosphatidyltransferase family protein [Actinomycetes bacterium]
MLSRHAKSFATRLFNPVAGGLLRLGVTPDAVTWAGTLVTVTASLWFYPRGEFFLGSLVIACFVIFDTLDGTMARLSGRSSRWGAFLDSTLDRVADAALFAGLLLWFTGEGDDPVLAGVTLVVLIGGGVVSYTKARAEGLGLTCNVGIAERAERIILVLVTTGLAGLLDWPWLQAVGLWVLAALTVVTIGQRMVEVRRQATVEPPVPGA